MGYDYGVSRFSSGLSIIVLMGTFQPVKRDPNLNGEPNQYAYGTAFGGHPLPDGATQWVRTLDIHVLDLLQTMKAAPQWKRSRQEQPQQVQVSQWGYCYHQLYRRSSEPYNVDPVEGTSSDTVRRGPVDRVSR